MSESTLGICPERVKCPRVDQEMSDALGQQACSICLPIAYEGLAEQNVALRNVIKEAQHDYLTNLRGRELFIEDAERLQQRVKRNGGQIIIAFMDANDLKTLNDTRGHGAGDRLLVNVARALRTEFRPADIVGRWSGDEFTAAPHFKDVPSASEVARFDADIKRRLNANIALFNHATGLPAEKPSVSIGIAPWEIGEPLSDAINRADALMYQDKQQQKQL
jgi:diguanylate cyclase (GGDEF)-like protein